MTTSLRTFTKDWLYRIPALRRRGRVVVLCYHSIHSEKHFATSSPEMFKKHLDWLGENVDVIRFEDVVPRVRLGGLSRPAVAITFDDGYQDNYDHAFTSLVDRGMPATFFLTVGLLERDPAVLGRFRQLRETSDDEIAPLEWGQVREMKAEGMTFGSHTWSHPNLAKVSDTIALEEFRSSKSLLEERLGEPVISLAYPFGKPRRQLNGRTLELARDAGYRLGGTILSRAVRKKDDPIGIPRFFVTKDSERGLMAKVTGRLDSIGVYEELVPTWLARKISPEDFSF